MIKPAAEGGGQPTRGRGVASERRVAGTWPASGGARAEPLPSEVPEAPWWLTASLDRPPFFSSYGRLFFKNREPQAFGERASHK